jgi:sugar phosphate permease
MKLIGRASTPDEGRWRIYNKIAAKILPLILLGYTIASIDKVNVSFAKLQMGQDLGLSNSMYGFGAGVFFVGYCLFEIPSNVILHRVGARIWLARIMIVWGLLSACTMFVRTPEQFYVVRFLLGASEAGFYPGALLFLTNWFPRFARGQAVSVMLLGSSFSAIVGSPLSGAIMGFLDHLGGLRGWQWLFLVEGLPATLLGLTFLAVLPNRPAEASWLGEEEKKTVTDDLALDHASQAKEGARHRFGDAFRNVNIWCLVVANFCNLCSLYGIQFWLPTIIQRAVHTTIFVTGLVAAGLTLIPCAVLIINGRHSDRTGERRWHATWGFLATIAGLVIAGTFSDNAFLALAGLVLANSGVVMVSGTIFTLPGTFTLGAAAAVGFALITTIGNFAGYASPFMIGVLRDATGNFSAAFFGMATAAMIGATAILAAPGLRTKRKESAKRALSPEIARQ